MVVKDNESTKSEKRRGLLRFLRRRKKTPSTASASASPRALQSMSGDNQSIVTAPPVLSKDQHQHQHQKTSPVATSPARTATSAARSSDGPPDASSSWLSRSRRFRKMSDASFALVDVDGSGTVDVTELYSGLLLIHLKLGMYAGPAACRPLDRERVAAVFKRFDTDHSGHLDHHEFRQVMLVLFSNVVLRVLVQWSMTILIVPLVAKIILDAIYAAIEMIYLIVVNLDEYSSVANSIELAVEGAWAWMLLQTPPSVLEVFDQGGDLWAKVPDAVWNSIPLTLLSTLLGVLVVPNLIFRVDEFFQYLAARNSTSSTTTTATTTTTTKAKQH